MACARLHHAVRPAIRRAFSARIARLVRGLDRDRRDDLGLPAQPPRDDGERRFPCQRTRRTLRVDFPPDWGLHGDVDATKFAPAKYEDGPWGAEVGTSLSPDARAVLALADHPVVAKRSEGAGEIVALGGNLLFHADYTRSLAERSFLVAYFVAAGEDPPARELSGSFRDPEHRVMTLDGPAIVLIKESWTPAWRAQLRTGDQERSIAVLEAGPGVMAVIVPAAGTLQLTYGARLVDLVSWALFVVGVGLCVFVLMRRGA